MNIETLKAAGIDYQKGVARFLDDSELYENMLLTFLDDKTFEQAGVALKEKNYHRLFECTHSLKGIAGNLDLTPLYQVSCQLTELLRFGGEPDQARLEQLYAQFVQAHAQICQGISDAQA